MTAPLARSKIGAFIRKRCFSSVYRSQKLSSDAGFGLRRKQREPAKRDAHLRSDPRMLIVLHQNRDAVRLQKRPRHIGFVRIKVTADGDETGHGAMMARATSPGKDRNYLNSRCAGPSCLREREAVSRVAQM